MSDDIGQLEADLRARIDRGFVNGGPRITRDDISDLLERLADEYNDPDNEVHET